ncbi:phosphonate transport system substrate-binding protein [Desulfosoma caldarium]|uniref:Phosphonate transport system substrate-binding protein n=1 Tax=Desulfosoma caldarium TaxID=610254 RepID=A0A3N1UQR5_9BACT|nr:phosphonate transport system substrate-binding protein [Desulfosoma caldarium]
MDFSVRTTIPSVLETSGSSKNLTVAVGAMVSPRATLRLYRQLLDYVGWHMDRKVELVQKKTYGELSRLFAQGAVDLAFVCTGSYVLHRPMTHWELLVAPQIMGQTTYQSYLIVHKDSPYLSFDELRHKIFAFTDPHSNTGRLVPTAWVVQSGSTPEAFFSQVLYTYGHDNSILAVAKGLVDGAAVDSLVWEYEHARDDTWTSKTKIIRRSIPFGIPPVVVSPELSPQDKETARRIFLTMHENEKGRSLLNALGIDRFVVPDPSWYEETEKLLEFLHSNGIRTDGLEPAQH